jgi:hypothetical protein
MKKSLLSLLLFFQMAIVAQAQIVITEIMYNPPESGTDSLEYIEILNNSNTAVTMSGWTLEFGTGPTTFAIPDINLGAGQYQLFSVNSVALQNNFGKASIQWTSGGLSNNGAPVRIKNAAAAIIDEVVYDDVAPWPTEPDGNGASLVLCDPNTDNSQPNNWKAAQTAAGFSIGGIPVFANPGAASGCLTGLICLPDVAFVVPGQTVIVDVTNNDNIPVTPGANSLTIATPPANGTASAMGDSAVIYVPNQGFCGTDVLTYQFCDAPGSCATATVTFNVKCYPVRSIEQMNNINGTTGVADSINASCELVGTVYGVNLRASSNGLQFSLLNNNGSEGIAVFRGVGTFGYTVTEGDRVTVRGSIAQFNGLTQINIDTVFKNNGNNPLVAPQTVVNVSEGTESRLVIVKLLRYVDIAQWTPGVGAGFTVRMYSNNSPSDTVAVRIDNDIDLFNQQTPPVEPMNITGLGGQFDGSSPFNSGYQLLPRYSQDIEEAVNTKLVNYSAEVKLSPNPVKDMLNIRTTVNFERITIFGHDGKVLHQIAHPDLDTQITLAGTPAGVYAVRFEKEGGVWTTAVIKY